MAELNDSRSPETQPAQPVQPSTSFVLTSHPHEVKSPAKEFKKTHRRNESKLSKISHLSIRSLRGTTLEEEDEVDGEEKKPIYLFESLFGLCPWMPKLYLPGSFRISNIKRRLLQFWINHKIYDDRILVIGNKFSEHLYRELNIDLKKVQTRFAGGRRSNRTCTSKYTILSFLPVNLYEQFRRIANFYFLLTLIFAFIFKSSSPISPNSWLLSLIFVVVVTMVKQAYEDFLRHRSDK